ncbi:hypothetical protein PL11_000085 [Lentilactobacillus curieae]|uniref:Enoyl reductase (ER) domain-containing protein n=1 Tax=Lentilactobacillus curieae TaxID=1138822 RepID=A0A1S6QFT2_9LACO|nr:zinc-binding dehydrogenase [Lentilactobacillus curieae]AQW20460.1 hypothetical protein PL11_000085 [Lentilactobacillus curieae]
MKAIVLREPGDVSNLKYEERTIPTATESETVVEVKAFGLNHAESVTRKGGSPSVKLPRVIGIELVGTVLETKSAKFKPGDAVFTFQGGLGREFDGSYQEYALIPNQSLYHIPEGIDLSWDELATIPQSGYTAYGSMMVAKIHSGDHVLLRGGTTTVGLDAAMLLHAMGAKVSASTRNPEHSELLKSVGVDEVVIDQAGVLQTAEKYDAIIDFVGVTTMADTLKHIKIGHIVVETGELDDEWGDKFNIFTIPTGSYLTSFQSSYIRRDWLEKMFSLIKTDQISFKIGKTFNFDEIHSAHELLDEGKSMGKIVIRVKE